MKVWGPQCGTETIVHPRLHHLGLTTSNLDALIAWYRKVLGMGIVHRTSAAAGGKDVPAINAAWVTNDEANHRLAFVQLPGLNADLDRSHNHRIQHVAFEYRTLDDLLGTYTRLKGLGIEPVLCTDGGSQTAFYYEDPDRNSVELNVDNYGLDLKRTYADVGRVRKKPNGNLCRSGQDDCRP
jgi:catechol 2,3-dioxygenase